MSDLTEYSTTVNGHELTVQMTDEDARAAGLLEPVEAVDIEAAIAAEVEERMTALEAEFEQRVAAEVTRLSNEAAAKQAPPAGDSTPADDAKGKAPKGK